MKIKRKICLIFLIIILLGTTTVYGSIRITNTIDNATDSTVTTDNSINNENNGGIISNSASTNNSSKNRITSNETSSNIVEDNKTEKSTNSTIKNSVSNKEEVLDDIYLIEVENDLNYENTYINGNVYIMSSYKVTFSQCEILGNIFIISDSFEMIDTVVNGSVYVISGETKFTSCDLYSVYAGVDSLLIDEDTVISTDVRIAGTDVTISGTVERNAYIASDTVEIENSADIVGKCELTTKEYDVPKSIENSDNFSVTIVEETENTTMVSLSSVLGGWGCRVIIVLIIAIIILGGSPKFTAVNCTLRIRDFFKAFFTGILEIVIIFAILIAGMALGFGSGYLIAIMFIMIGLLCLGKAIFILSFAIRLVNNKNKNPRVKAFIYTIIIAIILEAINLFAVFGDVGVIAVLIINLVLSITGFGSFIRVVLTARKKRKLEPEQKENRPQIEPRVPQSPVAVSSEPKQVVPKVEPMVEEEKKVEPEEVKTEPKMIEIPIKKSQPETPKEEPKQEIKEEPKQEQETVKSEKPKEIKEEVPVQEEKNEEPVVEIEKVENPEKIEKTDDFVISDKNKKRKKLFGKDK